MILLFVWEESVAGPLFVPGVNYPTGNSPYGVAIGDLNGDGKLDLAVANYNSSTVSVLLGLGNGSFGPKTDFATGSNPFSVAIGNLNAGGVPDLAVTNYGAATVSVLLGDGTGGFGPKTDSPTGNNPQSVAIKDLNGDGRADLAVANAASNTVSVLLGNGAGGFGPKTDFPTANNPTSVAIEDLNGGGVPDLVVANAGAASVSVLLGNGTGGFGPKTDFPTGNTPNSVAITELNGDDKLDLATANYGSGTASVLLGDGAGGFGPMTDFTAGSNPFAVVLGDLDGDGKPDLAVTNSGFTPSVSVLLGNGAGGFGPKTDFSTPYNAVWVVRGDLNGDGGPDLAVTSYFSNVVTVLLSRLAPTIASIEDVSNDQGGKVHVLWNPSVADTAPSYHISSYNLWRRITTTAALRAVEDGAASLESGADFEGSSMSRAIRVTTEGTQSVYWEYIVSVPARGQSGYGYMAPTTSDSMAGGIPWNVFFVDAKHATSAGFFVSAPDSGYSVDNLPPGPPAQLAGEYLAGSNATVLHWAISIEPDLSYYKLYRGSSAEFVPGPGNLIAAKGDTGYTDAGSVAQYYKLSAVDIHGNESAFALLTPSQTLDVGDGAPLGIDLEGVRPNPTRGRILTVRFVLPIAAPARLELLDVSGRLVVSRDVGPLGVGRHAIDLAEGVRLSAGLYWARLTQGADTRVRRVVVMQ